MKRPGNLESGMTLRQESPIASPELPIVPLHAPHLNLYMPDLPADGLPPDQGHRQRMKSPIRRWYSTTYRSTDAPEFLIGRDVSSSNPAIPYSVTRGRAPERSV